MCWISISSSTVRNRKLENFWNPENQKAAGAGSCSGWASFFWFDRLHQRKTARGWKVNRFKQPSSLRRKWARSSSKPLRFRSQRSEQADSTPAAPVQKTSYGPIPSRLQESFPLSSFRTGIAQALLLCSGVIGVTRPQFQFLQHRSPAKELVFPLALILRIWRP